MTYDEYKARRAGGARPSSIAYHKTVEEADDREVDWNFDLEGGTVESTDPRIGLKFRIEIDDCPDYSWLGDIHAVRSRDDFDPPTGYPAEFVSGYRDSYWLVGSRPTREVAAEYAKLGYARHRAWTKAKAAAEEDMTRLRRLVNDDWCFVYIVVAATVNGVEVASAGMGGIESDSGTDYFEEVIRDSAYEAEAEAAEWIDNLVTANA
jgi:hypothetical protein